MDFLFEETSRDPSRRFRYYSVNELRIKTTITSSPPGIVALGEGYILTINEWVWHQVVTVNPFEVVPSSIDRTEELLLQKITMLIDGR